MKTSAKFLVLPVALAIAAAVAEPARAGVPVQTLTKDVGFRPQIGNAVSSRTGFLDENGQSVEIGRYLHRRPLVLLLGYYRCPMLCGVDLNATVRTVDEFPPAADARDFEFVFVSIDPTETPMAAAEKKAEYLRRLGWEPAAARWHFLTGTAPAIATLAQEVGFQYRYDDATRQYVHPSGLVILTPEGKVSSYLFGIQYPAAEFDGALAAARREAAGPLGQLVSILCFSHNPVAGTTGYYVLIALRVLSLGTLGGLAWAVGRRWRRKERPA